MNTIQPTANQLKFDRQMIVIGTQVKPITNIPADARVRIRTSPVAVPRAFVKTKEGISEHIIIDCGDHWEIYHKPERFNFWGKPNSKPQLSNQN